MIETDISLFLVEFYDVIHGKKGPAFNRAGDFTAESHSSTTLLFLHRSRQPLTLDEIVTGPELDTFLSVPKFPVAINDALQITGIVQPQGNTGPSWGFLLTPLDP